MPQTYVYRYAHHVEGMVKINQRPTAELQFRPAAYPEPNAPTVRIPPLAKRGRMSPPPSHWLRVESFSSTVCPCAREISRKLDNAELKPLVSPTWRK
jgi:GTP cyclohydrolase FolE2